MAELLSLQGADVISAPSLKEVPLESNREAFEFADRLFDGRIDVLIFLTGVGARTLLETLSTRRPKEEILSAFSKIPIVPRGPKPVRVLAEWKIAPALLVPEPNTWKELVASLDAASQSIPLSRRTVALQEYGEPNEPLVEALRERGAEVLRVPVYRWTLPDDTRPLEEAVKSVCAGKADALVFTTSVQVTHVLAIADKLKLATEFRRALGSVVIASVGPDCTRTLIESGLRADIEPESPKMGPLAVALADRAAGMLKKLRARA